MVKDAEANKEADKKKRETVDVRNQADTIVHTTEKNLKEHGSKISDTDKKAIETGIADLRNALKGTEGGINTVQANGKIAGDKVISELNCFGFPK